MDFLEFYNKYFEINLNDYKSIGIDLEISKVLLAFLIAIIIATIIININRAAIITLTKKTSGSKKKQKPRVFMSIASVVITRHGRSISRV